MEKVKNDENKKPAAGPVQDNEIMSLNDVIRAAKEAGVSYGHYVAMQYMHKQHL